MAHLKKFVSLLVLLVVGGNIQSCRGWVARMVVPISAEHEQKCFIKEGSATNNEPIKDIALEVGEEHIASIGNCFKLACNEQTTEGYPVFITGCGLIAVEPPCKVVENKTLPFPECCPTVQC